jgi:hypothetical protein
LDNAFSLSSWRIDEIFDSIIEHNSGPMDQFTNVLQRGVFQDWEPEAGYLKPKTVVLVTMDPVVRLPNDDELVWVFPCRVLYERMKSYLEEEFIPKHPEESEEIAANLERLYAHFKLDEPDPGVWAPYIERGPNDYDGIPYEVRILGDWVAGEDGGEQHG